MRFNIKTVAPIRNVIYDKTRAKARGIAEYMSYIKACQVARDLDRFNKLLETRTDFEFSSSPFKRNKV